MKKSSLLFVAFMLLGLTIKAQVDLKNGLIAYYPFNGNANDESGNGNNGTVKGAPLTTDRFGNLNSAYFFDGLKYYIEIPASNHPTGNVTITYALWVNTILEFTTQVIISVGYDSANYHHSSLSIDETDKLYYSAGYSNNFYSLKKNSLNNWHFVVCVKSNENIKFYIDGIFIEEGLITAKQDVQNTKMFIGKDDWDNFFKGEIDDIRIYNRVLNDQEISSLYNATSQPIAQPVVKIQPVTNAPVTPALDYGYGASDARTVNVGAQEWLAKNLNVSRFANGDAIPEARTTEEFVRANENKQPSWCYYNNDPANGRIYGKLYNWYAVNDPRGLAPKGWHIPTDEEWTVMINYLGGEATAGLAIKSTSGWSHNGNGNNGSGITALPGGYSRNGNNFRALGDYGAWWSSSEDTPEVVWQLALGYSAGSVSRTSFASESLYLSVRCIRD